MKNRRNTLKNKNTKKHKKNGKKMIKKRSTFRKKIRGGFLGWFKRDKEEKRPVILGPEPTGNPKILPRAQIYAETKCLGKYYDDYDECIEKNEQFFKKFNPPVKLPDSELPETPSQ